VFETEDHELYAIEIKRTQHPDKSDVRNLLDFKKAIDRQVRLVLFHAGEEYLEIDGVQLIPVGALYRGQ